jgi:hypothetical protein
MHLNTPNEPIFKHGLDFFLLICIVGYNITANQMPYRKRMATDNWDQDGVD